MDVERKIRKLLKNRKALPVWVICNLYHGRYNKFFTNPEMKEMLDDMDGMERSCIDEYHLTKEK